METRQMKTDVWHIAILGITTAVLIFLWSCALVIGHYQWDFFILMLLLWALFFIRNKIKLHPFHYFLAACFLVLHDVGMFGTYRHYYLGLEYDLYVHGFFGIVAAFILRRTYHLVGPYRGWLMYFAIIAVLLGMGAFHELFEYAGAIIGGKGEGVLLVGTGDLDAWDVQKDMLNNLIGGLIGLGLIKISSLVLPHRI